MTDGPFAESKEFLVGYWIVDVENAERAYAIAGKASTAPGPGGKLRRPLRDAAARAHLLERSGKITAALPYYEAAAEKTASIPERTYLLLNTTAPVGLMARSQLFADSRDIGAAIG